MMCEYKIMILHQKLKMKVVYYGMLKHVMDILNQTSFKIVIVLFYMFFHSIYTHIILIYT